MKTYPAFFVFYLFFLQSDNLRNIITNSPISKIATIMGINKERVEMPNAATFSPVATTGLPAPIVNLEEVSRARILPPYMVAAAPPPTMNPVVHFNKLLSIGNTDVISSVPAITERGVVMLSNRLSTNGT